MCICIHLCVYCTCSAQHKQIKMSPDVFLMVRTSTGASQQHSGSVSINLNSIHVFVSCQCLCFPSSVVKYWLVGFVLALQWLAWLVLLQCLWAAPVAIKVIYLPSLHSFFSSLSSLSTCFVAAQWQSSRTLHHRMESQAVIIYLSSNPSGLLKNGLFNWSYFR